MNLLNIFRNKKSEEISDLTPRGIAKSIIPEGHTKAKELPTQGHVPAKSIIPDDHGK